MYVALDLYFDNNGCVICNLVCDDSPLQVALINHIKFLDIHQGRVSAKKIQRTGTIDTVDFHEMFGSFLSTYICGFESGIHYILWTAILDP